MSVIAQATSAGSGLALRMRVGQAWVGPEERETMPVINPSTGQAIADVPIATDEDAQAATQFPPACRRPRQSVQLRHVVLRRRLTHRQAQAVTALPTPPALALRP